MPRARNFSGKGTITLTGVEGKVEGKIVMTTYTRAILANPGALMKMPTGILPAGVTFGERVVNGYARLPFAQSPMVQHSFKEVDQTLKGEGLIATPYHRQLFLLGCSVENQSIALDLDGTLIRFHNTPEPDNRLTLSFQLKSGAEAWLLGLSQRNRLLLYTSRDTDSLTAILNNRNPMRQVFLPHVPRDREATPADVYQAPNIFSMTNWAEMMRDLANAVLDGGRSLIGWEEFVMERLALYHEAPLIYGIHALMHLKLPEIAEGQGKIPFDFIVDDSNGLAELLELSKTTRLPLRPIHLPHTPQSKRPEDLNYPDDSILRAALALLKLTREPTLSSITVETAEAIVDDVVYGGQLTLPAYVQFRAKEIEAMEERLKEWRNHHG